MEVHDEYIPEEAFAEFTERMPEVCVEVVLQTDAGVLLAKRTNDPVKDEWFWPGGRLYKGEELAEAAHRVAAEELGIEIHIEGQLGVYSHFWDTSALPGAPSRHTVNVVFLAQSVEDPSEIALDDQHSDYRFVTELDPDFHEYVRRYLADGDLV
ncbi:NUDIX domain-containing protein [Halobacteriales archaeon Cl-PHB]